MKATLDSKRRVVFPDAFSPGDIVDVELTGPDTAVVRRMNPVDLPQPKLVRRSGRLVLDGGQTLTNEDVRRLIEDES
jgi:hypothetical protein